MKKKLKSSKTSRYVYGHDTWQDCVYGRVGSGIDEYSEVCYTMSLSAAKKGVRSLYRDPSANRDTRAVYKLVRVR